MNKITLSLLATLSLYGADLGTIQVTQTTDSKILENVSNNEVKSADLAETLYKEVPSINLIRRSGIANDITLRGQKRDNIVVTVDDAKVCGACPNRMDPPTSHIVTANVESVTVSEGPFDVEEFGVLSGEVKVKMKEPTKTPKGELETTLGSFGYKKFGTKLSGGNEKVKILFSASYEQSDQYKDGDGNTLAQQLLNAITGTPQATTQYAPAYKNAKAFTKKTAMLKSFINLSKNQKLELSYTINKSDNVLYTNSKMDALYDDSTIYNLQYNLKHLAPYSKNFTLKLYRSDVEHPMSTKFRLSSGINSSNEVISSLTTKMEGIKAINDANFAHGTITYGIDLSLRNWNGEYIGYGMKAGVTGKDSIADVDTINRALFVKYTKDFGMLNIKTGLRYNDTTITTDDARYDDRNFDSFDANIVSTLSFKNDLKIFLALGQASRVPDARELYFQTSMGTMAGAPTLDAVTNKEVDAGIEKKFDNAYFKLKGFYSKLENYIYFHKGLTQNNFENIDAKIYGVEFLGSVDVTDEIYVDLGASYKRGKKDEALAGQSDTDLADITPLKINAALNLETENDLTAKLEYIHAEAWKNYDADNGEQYLPSYDVFNVKATKAFNKHLEVTLGIDNIFDTTYAVSNTYADLTLLSDGSTGDVMLLNEPGRYVYTNIKYKF